MTPIRIFILGLFFWLAAACTLANPSRPTTVAPIGTLARTAAPEATLTATVETVPAVKRTGTTPADLPSPRSTATFSPSPTVDLLACVPDRPSRTGMVSWVIDGETFVIDIGGRQETVRLLGIDAVPLTADITRSLLDRRVVRLVTDRVVRDATGRILSYVLYLDGRFINDELIRTGAARLEVDDVDLACGEQFILAEDFAIQEGLGIWGYAAVAALPTELQPTASASLLPVTPAPTAIPTVTPAITSGAIITNSPDSTPAPTQTQGIPTNTLPPTITVGPPPVATATPTATQPVATGTVSGTGVQIVNIFYDGTLDPYEPDEYIEIKNFENIAVELTDWWFFADSDAQFFFFPDFTLPAGQSCRIYSNTVQADSCVDDSFRSYLEVWNNVADCGYLYDWDFSERSSFCYGEVP